MGGWDGWDGWDGMDGSPVGPRYRAPTVLIKNKCLAKTQFESLYSCRNWLSSAAKLPLLSSLFDFGGKTSLELFKMIPL